MIIKIFVFFLLISTSNIYANDNKAGLMIYPVRIILDNGTKNAELVVKNNGYAKGGYKVEIVDVSMPEDGAIYIMDSDQKDDFSAKDFMRTSPKSFSIEEFKSQIIRIAVKPPIDLIDGEYRSHVKILLSNNDLDKEDNVNNTESMSKLLVDNKISMIIPVIYRHGKTDYNISIDNIIFSRNVKIDKSTTSFIDINLKRIGNRSSTGNIEINYIDDNNKKFLLKTLKDVVIYRSTEKRRISTEINIDPNLMITDQGKINITYSSLDSEKIISKDFNM